MVEPNYSSSSFPRIIAGMRMGYVDAVAEGAASPDEYAHRRSYSDIYNNTPSPYLSNSMSKHKSGLYAIQPYTPPSFQMRERRTRSWDLSADPELLRKKRLAAYKVYGIEGKVKSTVKKSFHWVKGKYNKLLYGFK
eukprot:c24032_g1_i1 orf=890-1297(+)